TPGANLRDLATAPAGVRARDRPTERRRRDGTRPSARGDAGSRRGDRPGGVRPLPPRLDAPGAARPAAARGGVISIRGFAATQSAGVAASPLLNQRGGGCRTPQTEGCPVSRAIANETAHPTLKRGGRASVARFRGPEAAELSRPRRACPLRRHRRR